MHARCTLEDAVPPPPPLHTQFRGGGVGAGVEVVPAPACDPGPGEPHEAHTWCSVCSCSGETSSRQSCSHTGGHAGPGGRRIEPGGGGGHCLFKHSKYNYKPLILIHYPYNCYNKKLPVLAQMVGVEAVKALWSLECCQHS